MIQALCIKISLIKNGQTQLFNAKLNLSELSQNEILTSISNQKKQSLSVNTSSMERNNLGKETLSLKLDLSFPTSFFHTFPSFFLFVQDFPGESLTLEIERKKSKRY